MKTKPIALPTMKLLLNPLCLQQSHGGRSRHPNYGSFKRPHHTTRLSTNLWTISMASFILNFSVYKVTHNLTEAQSAPCLDASSLINRYSKLLVQVTKEAAPRGSGYFSTPRTGLRTTSVMAQRTQRGKGWNLCQVCISSCILDGETSLTSCPSDRSH